MLEVKNSLQVCRLLDQISGQWRLFIILFNDRFYFEKPSLGYSSCWEF